jgi:hypothetical protein
LGNKTSDTARAAIEAGNAAENIKSMRTAAQIERYIEDFTPAQEDGGEAYYRYFDGGWNVIGGADGAEFFMRIGKSTDSGSYASGDFYRFSIGVYRTSAYPFIDDNKVKEDENYIPLLVLVETGRFILEG